MDRYWRVEYRSLTDGSLEHNAIVGDFNEFAALACGRLAIITGEATEAEYMEALSDEDSNVLGQE